MPIKDLLNEEARRIAALSELKEEQVEAEDRLRTKTTIALIKMQRAKEKVKADEKGKGDLPRTVVTEKTW